MLPVPGGAHGLAQGHNKDERVGGVGDGGEKGKGNSKELRVLPSLGGW